MEALRLTSPSECKVIILGQDPYIRGEAHGLSFSSQLGMTPSLEIIFEELERTGFRRDEPNLTDWATQGVLLLNTILTTRLGYSLAHEHYGWQDFTKAVLFYMLMHQTPVSLMAWGRPAQEVANSVINSLPIETDHIQRLTAYHPVAEHRNPAQYKFVGCNHFVLANQWLVKRNRTPIQWQNPERQMCQREN